MKQTLIALLAIGLIFGVYVFFKTDNQPTPPTPPAMEEMAEEKMEEMTYQYKGTLSDVTEGKIVTGIDTKGNAAGMVQATYEQNTYSLLATFDGLPDPQGTDFYEGWVVRKGENMSVISTGRAEKVDGKYQNTFEASQDLTDHDYYVLTIEPDDGDPAPAEHILDGTMVKQ